jgi:predicted permease
MTPRLRRPPLADWLLRRQPLGARRAEIEADLDELYAARTRDRGERYARRRYYRDVLSLWRSYERTFGTAPRRRASDLSGLRQDVSYAVRLFRQTPGLVTVAVAGLAVAIGISTSIFSIVNGLAFKPTGIEDPATAFRIYRADQRGTSSVWAYGEYLQMRAAAGIAVEGWLPERHSLFATAEVGQGQAASAMFVSGGYLPALTRRVSAGRLLSPADDSPGVPAVAVLSHGFWTRQLGSDATIVGRTLTWNGLEVSIAGVAAKGFRGTGESAPDLWLPLAAFPRLIGGTPLGQDGSAPIALVGRVASSLSVSQAEARLAAAAAGLQIPASVGRELERATAVQLRPAESSIPGSKRGTILIALSILTAAVTLLLLLACVNVANLLLAMGIGRRRELGVRIALGAPRRRIVRQLLTESLALGLAGGAAGLLLTIWLLPVLTRLAGVPATLDVTPDFNVLAFVVAVSIGAGIGAGIAPARHAADDDVSAVLKSGSGAGRTGGSERIRSTLVAAQAAASIVLIVIAALLTRGMFAATRVDIGFAADRLLMVRPTLPAAASNPLAAGAYFDAAVERLSGVPGIEAVALASFPPYGGSSRVTVFNRPGGRYTVNHNDTSANYFSALGLRVLRGRSYTAGEAAGGARVALISNAVARDFFAGDDPIGQTLERVVEDPQTTIIGVVSDAITARLREQSSAAIYYPMRDRRDARLLIRTHASPPAQIAAVRSALQGIDPRVRLDVSPTLEAVDKQLGEARVLASLAATLAGVALVLAVVGLHGVTAFVVAQRRAEISLRVALGASRRDVARLLLGDSLRPVALGLAAGILLALLIGRLMAGALFGVGGADPLAFATSVGILLASALAAIAGPARRACSVEPAAVLKQL